MNKMKSSVDSSSQNQNKTKPDVIDAKKHSGDSLSLIVFGGTGEIGMNLCAYRHKGKYLVVDMGIGFDVDLPADNKIVVPKIDFLVKHKDDVVGIVVTHGHDDHIGGIPYLWKQLRCKIYATKFPAELLRKKADDGILLDHVRIVERGVWVDIEPFKVRFLSITHSIPESSAIAIRTYNKTIVHTGDWKIDVDPVIGAKTDEEGFKQLGAEGVTAIFCDSTNILETHSDRQMRSEKSVTQGLEKLVKNAEGARVMISCISTNIARMKTCYEVARKCGRRLCLVGRSLLRVHEAAENTGYWDPKDKVLNDIEGGKAERGSVLYLCTGSQSENRSSTERIAKDTHPYVTAEPGDVMIFAARTIMGNERAINNTTNLFADKQVKTIFPSRENHIHVSGHPVQEDVATLYSWLKPRYVIPAHGEAQHLMKHCEFARKHGLESLYVRNGQEVVFKGEERPQILSHNEPGRLMVDGSVLLAVEGPAVKERYELQRGLIIVIISGNRVRVDAVGLEDQPEVLKEKLSTMIKQRLEYLEQNSKMSYYKTQVNLVRYVANEMRITSKRRPVIRVYMSGRNFGSRKRELSKSTEA